MNRAAYQELSQLPRGHAQVVEPSPPILTIAKNAQGKFKPGGVPGSYKCQGKHW